MQKLARIWRREGDRVDGKRKHILLA